MIQAFRDDPADEQQLVEFWQQYQKKLYLYALAILKEKIAAEDAVQSSFLIILRSFDLVRGYEPNRMLSYMCTIVRHECGRALNQSHTVSPVEEIEVVGEDPDPTARELLRETDREVLKACIAELQPNYRTALRMKYYDNASDEAIAAVLQVGSGNVRVVLTRARKKLKQSYLKAMQDSLFNRG